MKKRKTLSVLILTTCIFIGKARNADIPPYSLQVTFSKTVHIIFPAAITYVDLGSDDLLAAKAAGVENVLRVKASVRDFSQETNLSVITSDGNYYTFTVTYADEPARLTIEMTDLQDGRTLNRPNSEKEIYLEELGSESPMLVNLIMRSIYSGNRNEIKHIGGKRFGIQHTLKGIYIHQGLLYFHIQLKNSSKVPFDVDYMAFKVIDKQVAKRTAVQEQTILPIRAYSHFTRVGGNKTERVVFTLPKFTLADDKRLVVELFEKEGGRHQVFYVENEDLLRAKSITNLRMNF